MRQDTWSQVQGRTTHREGQPVGQDKRDNTHRAGQQHIRGHVEPSVRTSAQDNPHDKIAQKVGHRTGTDKIQDRAQSFKEAPIRQRTHGDGRREMGQRARGELAGQANGEEGNREKELERKKCKTPRSLPL